MKTYWKASVLLSIAWILMTSFIYGQSDSIQYIDFNYDQSGNRINREIVYYQGGQKSLFQPIEVEESEIEFEKELNIYPNPFTSSIYLTLNEEAYNAKVKIIFMYDNAGKIIKEIPVYEYVNKLDVSNLTSGTYIGKLIFDDSSKEWVLIKN